MEFTKGRSWLPPNQTDKIFLILIGGSWEYTGNDLVNILCLFINFFFHKSINFQAFHQNLSSANPNYNKPLSLQSCQIKLKKKQCPCWIVSNIGDCSSKNYCLYSDKAKLLKIGISTFLFKPISPFFSPLAILKE